MQVKSAINMIRWASAVASALVCLAIFFYFMGWKDMDYMIVYCTLILVAGIITLGKKYWIRYLFSKTQYPGILYGVCESLGYLRNLDVNPSDEILDDLYKPVYHTEVFLSDNDLDPRLYAMSPAMAITGNIFSYAIPLSLLLYLCVKDLLHTRQYYLIPVAVFIVCYLIGNYLKRKKDPAAVVRYSFSPEGLQMSEGVLLKWEYVYSWAYLRPQSQGEVARIELQTVQIINNQQIFTIELAGIAATFVYVCILLTHYKYKYGYTAGK